MLNRDIEKMQSLAEKIRKLNGKIKLISLLDKAHQEYEQSNYKECENTCKKILETQPNNFVALRGLGCVAQNKGDYELALEYYNKSLKTSLKKEIDKFLEFKSKKEVKDILSKYQIDMERVYEY